MELEQQSEFNSVVQFMNRVNELFGAGVLCSMRHDLYSWYMILLALSMELHNYMKVRIKEDKEYIGIINPMMASHNRIPNHSNLKKNDVLFWKLKEYHEFLKEIWKTSGFEAKLGGDPKKALGN